MQNNNQTDELPVFLYCYNHERICHHRNKKTAKDGESVVEEFKKRFAQKNTKYDNSINENTTDKKPDLNDEIKRNI